MYVLVIHHRVADYKAWKTVFDTLPPARAGARFHRIHRKVGDPNDVSVVAGFDTVEAAARFRDDPELEEAMRDADVMSTPRFELYEQVESVQY